MMSARALAGLALPAIVAAAGGAGCEDGTPVVRGFDSRQLLALRDPTLRFNPNGGYGSFTTHVIYTTGDEAAGETERYWSVDLQTGEIREHDALLTDVVPPPASASGRFTCTWGYASPDQNTTRTLAADRLVRVVYVVRGRNPSPQDGLWLATIDGAALATR
jgi:hypothetical protein